MLDLRVALRAFRRSPIFGVTALLTLAIGIGGTTVMFTLVQAVLLRPLPFAAPDRLVRVWETKPGESGLRAGVSPPDFVDWRARATSFADMALFGGDQVLAVIEAPSGSIQVANVDVTTNIFTVLGVSPLVGRGFSIEPGAPRSIVRTIQPVSRGAWSC